MKLTAGNSTYGVGQSAQIICSTCNGICGVKLKFDGSNAFIAEGQKDHSISSGYICPKGKAIPEIEQAPDRLRKPMLKLGNNEFKEIEWDEALDFVAEKFLHLKKEHGAESLAVHVGHAGMRKEFTPYYERLCHAFGTPNFSTAGSHCHLSKMMANRITYGVLPVPDFANSQCIVLWGCNPFKSYPPHMNHINKALKNGARLIVIDPKATATAKKANFHLQLRPGTDGALALAFLNVVIKENLYNQEFVHKWTVGFRELADLVDQYTPEKVEAISWVPADKIREAARLYAHTSPACIAPGIAVELQTNGLQGARAMAILQAICGNLDIKGGALLSTHVRPPSLRIKEWKNEQDKPAIGAKEYPIFYKFFRNAQANIYADAILEEEPYPLKGLMVLCSNPLLTWPNANKLKEALEKIEFLVVIEHFMTETARHADIVLPVATFLKRYELYDFSYISGESVLAMGCPVLPEELPTDWEICSLLARRLGLQEYFPWENEEEAFNERLQVLNLTQEDLQIKVNGHPFAARKEKKYEEEGFHTPSGKVEIYATVLKEYGYEPLPRYHEPSESPIATPGLAANYPLVASTGARSLGYLHSRYKNLHSIRRIQPYPVVEVHPRTAREMEIEDGELVAVETLRGKIELRVKYTEELDYRVIFIPHGWEEANANILTDNQALDPISGFPPDRSFLARIVKK